MSNYYMHIYITKIFLRFHFDQNIKKMAILLYFWPACVFQPFKTPKNQNSPNTVPLLHLIKRFGTAAIVNREFMDPPHPQQDGIGVSPSTYPSHWSGVVFASPQSWHSRRQTIPNRQPNVAEVNTFSVLRHNYRRQSSWTNPRTNLD